MKEQLTFPALNIGAEKRIVAKIVSRGIALGRAVCLFGRKRQFYRIDLDNGQIEIETERLDFAVKAATQQLVSLAQSRRSELPDIVSDIFDVHLLIINESSLVSNLKQTIIEQKINAEWAIKLVSEDYLNRYRSIPDDHLREKAVDLEDVTDRILNALYDEESVMRLPENAIIVASEIRPSTLMEFFNDRPAALVTEHGGWTSHAFIMARELGIPAVAGVKNVLRQIKMGQQIVVDALEGTVIINPNGMTSDTIIAKRELINARTETMSVPLGFPKTIDGREICIAANVDKPDLCRRAVEMGSNGIGLLRTEYLFDHLQGFPNEETQFKLFQEVVTAAKDSHIRIRTFDLGVDQLATNTGGREKNPALGMRAIRLSLSDEKNFRVQLRSILRASQNAHVEIVLPLISDVNEIIRTRQIFDDERRQLLTEGVEVGKPGLGAMIEVPAAVLSINEILRHVDFICLGTNDLVQYLLAVDRDNESVAEQYQTLHPAVLRSIKLVLDAANAANVPVIVCGEMAGSPFYTPLLIGLGATDLSMNLHSIADVHRLISSISYADTVELVKSIEFAETASETEEKLLDFYRLRWPGLFPVELFAANAAKHNKNITKN